VLNQGPEKKERKMFGAWIEQA